MLFYFSHINVQHSVQVNTLISMLTYKCKYYVESCAKKNVSFKIFTIRYWDKNIHKYKFSFWIDAIIYNNLCRFLSLPEFLKFRARSQTYEFLIIFFFLCSHFELEILMRVVSHTNTRTKKKMK